MMKYFLSLLLSILSFTVSLGQSRVPEYDLQTSNALKSILKLQNRNDFETASVQYNQLLKKTETLKISSKQKKEYQNIINIERANILEEENKSQQALEILLPLIDESNWRFIKPWSLTRAMVITSLTYEKSNDKKRCFHYLNQAKILIDKHKLNEQKPFYYMRLTSAHRVNGEISKAKKALDKAILFGEQYNDTLNLATSYMLHGFLFQESKSEFYKKSYHLFKELNNKNKELMILQNIISLYSMKKDTLNFIKYNNLALIHGDNHKLNPNFKWIYKENVNYYETVKNYKKALEFQKIVHQLDVEKASELQLIKINEITQKYEDEKKVIKIKEQYEELEFQKVQYNYLLIFFSCVIILSSFVFYFYLKTKRLNKNLQEAHSKTTIINTDLQRSINHQKTLQKELNHRVKNNLQLIISLLSLENKTEYKDVINRIQSIGNIHQLMYESDFHESISMDEYSNKMMEYFSESFTNRTDFSYTIETEGIYLNLQTIVPIGLILNELITNSIKHFNQTRKLLVNIRLSSHDNSTFTLHYSDNGSGITNEFQGNKSFGISVIKTMTNQLRGQVEIYNKDGAHFKFTFTEKQTSSW